MTLQSTTSTRGNGWRTGSMGKVISCLKTGSASVVSGTTTSLEMEKLILESSIMTDSFQFKRDFSRAKEFSRLRKESKRVSLKMVNSMDLGPTWHQKWLVRKAHSKMTCCTVKTVKSGTKTNSIRETVKNGCQDGKGCTTYFEDGSVHTGLYRDGFPKGQGEMT